MQIVYISNRPEILLKTLEHVALFMPFIDQVLVCAPDLLVKQFSVQETALPMRVLAESEILTDLELESLKGLDHQRRNYLLRSRLVEHSDVNDQFIMSDDDSRPLKHIETSRYNQDGKYHRYYFYDMLYWDNNQTEFDAGQISTCAVLGYNNLPQLSYASHMPQIIDKNILLESVEFFKQYSADFPICEWSSYFNYAGVKHRDRFHEEKPYMTLCWPEHPMAWKLYVHPPEYLFENFTPTCYKQVFEGIATNTADKESMDRKNINKISRWHKYSIESRHPEQGSSPLKYLRLRTWVNKLFNHLMT